MEKNILQELITLQQTKCIDVTVSNAVISIPQIINTQDLNVVDNFYQGKTVYIDVFLPSGEYDILSNTDNEILIDYTQISFVLNQVQPEPPAPELEPIIFSSEIPFKINCSSLGLVDDILVGDRKILIDEDTVVSVAETFTITSNTNNTITLSGDLNVEITGLILQRSLTFEALFEPFKSLMNAPNDRTFTKFECPNNNSFFVKYDVFTDIMIGYKNTYKDINKIDEIIGVLNDFLDINISEYTTKYELEPYYILTQEKLALIYNTIDGWTAYFERLKKLMSRIRIADSKVEGENYQNMYNAKPAESQIIIDELYNTYTVGGKESYAEYKQELMFEIKID